MCVFLEKAWRKWRVSVDTRYGRDWGKIRSTRSWSLRLVFDAVFSIGRHLSVVSILLSRFRARRFEELDSILMGVGGLSRWVWRKWYFFGRRPNPRFCLLILQSSALLLISEGKALIQSLFPLCAFHISPTRNFLSCRLRRESV